MADFMEPQSPSTADLCRSVKQLDEAVWRVWEGKNRLADRQAAAWRRFAVKGFCVALLLLTVGLWTYASRFQPALRTLIASGAVWVGFQSFRARRYGLAAVFAGLAALYNPLVPIFEFSGNWHLMIVLASAVPFAASLMRSNRDARADRFRLYPNRGWGRTRTREALR